MTALNYDTLGRSTSFWKKLKYRVTCPLYRDLCKYLKTTDSQGILLYGLNIGLGPDSIGLAILEFASSHPDLVFSVRWESARERILNNRLIMLTSQDKSTREIGKLAQLYARKYMVCSKCGGPKEADIHDGMEYYCSRCD